MVGSSRHPLNFLLTSPPRSLSLVRRHAIDVVGAAIAAVDPARLVRTALAEPAVQSFIGGGPLTLVAAGKAAAGMIDGFLPALDRPIRRGVAVGPGPGPSMPEGLAWYRGSHPIPDADSVQAGRAALRCAADAPASGCLVVLLSGGASALLTMPAPGVSLAEKVETTRVLLEAGVPIHELNCVRKHLSGVKGGRLAQATPGRVLTLAISDVVLPVEDDPGVIGSGPTVHDATRFAEALAIVERPAIGPRVPAGVRRLLEQGCDGLVDETLKTPPAPDRVMYRVVGSRRDAMSGAAEAARRFGYDVTRIVEPVIGEARVAGTKHAARAVEAASGSTGPWCVVSSGETTVTVSGGGRGGRNQELALAAVEAIGGLRAVAVLASVGTDGVDGPTDAAGAVVDTETALRARARRLGPPSAYLAENDAYAYFDQLGDLVRTGPTGTNVGDLQVMLGRPCGHGDGCAGARPPAR